MAVHLSIPYETLVSLVEQLPQEQQQDLLFRLQGRIQPLKPIDEAWIQLLRSAQYHGRVNEEPSLRREDWYDDER